MNEIGPRKNGNVDEICILLCVGLCLVDGVLPTDAIGFAIGIG